MSGTRGIAFVVGGALDALEAGAARVARLPCLAVTLLGLWSLVGQVCLVRAGVRGLRHAAS